MKFCAEKIRTESIFNQQLSKSVNLSPVFEFMCGNFSVGFDTK